MSSNSSQVGGSHYLGLRYQHWDMIEDWGIGYLEGCATKYICRQTKEGEDRALALEKARHYTVKLIEMATERKDIPIREPRGTVSPSVVSMFMKDYSIYDPHEQTACLNLLMWQMVGDLIVARDCLTKRILELRPADLSEHENVLPLKKSTD